MNVVHKYKDDDVARSRVCQNCTKIISNIFRNARWTTYYSVIVAFYIIFFFHSFLLHHIPPSISSSCIVRLSLGFSSLVKRHASFVLRCVYKFAELFFDFTWDAIYLKLIIKYTAGAGGRNDFWCFLRFYKSIYPMYFCFSRDGQVPYIYLFIYIFICLFI